MQGIAFVRDGTSVPGHVNRRGVGVHAVNWCASSRQLIEDIGAHP